MKNFINWFEIPANDLDRAVNFYERVLNTEIQRVELFGTKMGMLSSDGDNVSGAIVKGEDYKPSTSGTLIYLNAGNDLQIALSKVEENGGKILLPKTQISPEMGYFALFLDTEGNKLAFHSIH
ncbi:MAG TPA: VOC family protein [Saprospiraceae bacterium]|nr:VOC family protein [Saprospiraceae bacterium]